MLIGLVVFKPSQKGVKYHWHRIIEWDSILPLVKCCLLTFGPLLFLEHGWVEREWIELIHELGVIGVVCFQILRDHQVRIYDFFKNFRPIVFLPICDFLYIFSNISNARQFIWMQIQPILYRGAIRKNLFSSKNSFENICCQVLFRLKIMLQWSLKIKIFHGGFFLLIIFFIQPFWVNFFLVVGDKTWYQLEAWKTFVALKSVEKNAVSELFIHGLKTNIFTMCVSLMINEILNRHPFISEKLN